ncbi:hypothetical protein PPYR_04400 [Photinus pyralis]|uniref:F-box domain-containing protein n=1 Tax=Photinus pyralis TaxID=7054 RepID=A0A5N4AY01_PHOPY|nr:hypothetical protein PPYR_04400 [Photinus pyralis]
MIKNQLQHLLPSTLSNQEYAYMNTSNGLYLNCTYFPEEVMTVILSHITATHLLKCRIVCRKWNEIIKSHSLWSYIYERNYHTKATKRLPWYLYFCLFSTNYFNVNLLKNGNGEEGLSHWKLKVWEGDNYVEQVPICANPLPRNVQEFHGNESCLVTSYFSGFKSQLIQLPRSGLFRYILSTYKPMIYISEWTTARKDCSCVYKLQCSFILEDGSTEGNSRPFACYYKPQWQEGKWEKVELLIVDYPDNTTSLLFENEGCNTQSWKGHYGSKMAGGVVKLLFDSIQLLNADNDGDIVPRKFTGVKFLSNGFPQNEAVDYFKCDYIWSDNNEECYYFMP